MVGWSFNLAEPVHLRLFEGQNLSAFPQIIIMVGLDWWTARTILRFTPSILVAGTLVIDPCRMSTRL